MRITCPNCNAHYEIGEDMVPSEGRDVQCSNCGTTWFQNGRARSVPAITARAVPPTAPPSVVPIAPQTVPVPPPPLAPVPSASPPPVANATTTVANPVPRPGRRPIADERTAEILREERMRNERLRDEPPVEAVDAADARAAAPEDEARDVAAAERARLGAAAIRARGGVMPGPEAFVAPVAGRVSPGVSTDVGEDYGDVRTPAATALTEAEAEERDEMSDVIAATMRDAAASDDEGPVIAPAVAPVQLPRVTRRQLLPDIEEINSSLRPDDRAAAEETGAGVATAAPVSRMQAGFRIGFVGFCLLMLIFVAVYIFAAPLARAAPTMAETLSSYVAWIDGLRTDLATAVVSLTEYIAPDP